MNDLLYQRAWSLAITSAGQGKTALYGSEGLAVSDVRVVFDVERTLSGAKPNKAKFAITNLTPANRSNLAAGALVVLRAGYVSAAGVIFRGYVSKVMSKQDGPDVTTELECEDGGPNLTYGNVHLGYSSPVYLAQILQDVAKGLDVELSGVAFTLKGNIVQGVPRHRFRRWHWSGTVKSALDTLLKPRGMTWSIQCGSLLLQNSKGAINLISEVLASDTGLIGVPSRTATGVTCEALLNPKLTPGCAITILSNNNAVNGSFRAIKCKYQGDTEGSDWSVTIDGQPLLAPLAPVPTTQKGDFSAAEEAGDQEELSEGADGG